MSRPPGPPAPPAYRGPAVVQVNQTLPEPHARAIEETIKGILDAEPSQVERLLSMMSDQPGSIVAIPRRYVGQHRAREQ